LTVYIFPLKAKAFEYYGLAACYEKLGDLDEAIRLLKKSRRWGYEEAEEGLKDLEKQKKQKISKEE